MKPRRSRSIRVGKEFQQVLVIFHGRVVSAFGTSNGYKLQVYDKMSISGKSRPNRSPYNSSFA